MAHRLAEFCPLRPLPTDEEFDAAEAKYHALCAAHPEDQSDFGMGLPFVMQWYAAFTWAPLFGREAEYPPPDFRKLIA